MRSVPLRGSVWLNVANHVCFYDSRATRYRAVVLTFHDQEN